MIGVTTERRFEKADNGIYVRGNENDHFFERYKSLGNFEILARVHPVADTCLTDRLSPSFKFFELPKSNWKAIFKLLLATKRYSLILIRYPGFVSTITAFYCLLLNKPFAIELVADPDEELKAFNRLLHKVVGSIYFIFNKFIFKKALSVAPVTKSELQEKYCLANVVSSYSSVVLKDEWFANKVPQRTNKRLLFVGQVDKPYKRLDRFLDIFSELPESYSANIVLSGSNVDDIIEVINQRDFRPRIKVFANVWDPKKLIEIYDDSQFLVLCSEREGLPRVVIEGLCRNCIPFSVDVSGVSELLPASHIVKQGSFIEIAKLIDEFTAFDKVDNIDRFSHTNIVTASNKNYTHIKNHEKNIASR